MRILTVSAHYPPNFVSGGTLQPQRLAQGLRARGHDVSVYAGWLGDEAPLTAWEDTDATGMSVRWISSGAWIGWSDEHNWHNPAVADDFRAHLHRVRPDVVHFHSLQSLGAGLLPAAKASGARVVVTMHDFWWLCARQFLVDHDMNPCSLVVDAGVCPCEVDQPWRIHRGASLRTLLEAADLVLAPSASAAQVLAANGLPADRLRVDENGLPEALAEAAAAGPGRAPATDPQLSAERPLKVLYTGGPNPMKGVEVLLAAAALVDRPDRWSVTAYGIEEHLTKTDSSVDGLPVQVAPPFLPEDLDEILADHDVLVLPSVMRETHSLVTREALAAGLPVLCTDTLGPEEVVTHGVNGLVVPAADAPALASALRRLVDDQELLPRLRRGAAQPLAIRSLEEQVEGLDAAFASLVGGTAVALPTPPSQRHPEVAAVAEPTPVRRVVFMAGIEGAPLRYRVHLPAEALGLAGVQTEVRHYRDPDLLARCRQADVVVAYRVPATHQVLELIEAVRAAGTPVVFDVDDLIFDPEVRAEIPALRLLPPAEAELWLEGIHRYRTTLEACDAYIGSTELLVRQAAALTDLPSYRFDNGVGLVLAQESDRQVRRPRRAGPLRMGYLSGTTTHDEDWFAIEPAVADVLRRHPTAELWLGGHLPATPALTPFGDRIRRLPFVPWLELPAILRDLDVNLSPLAGESRFNEAKSAIKWLEAALVGTPTVASPTGPFTEAIVPGESGLLATGHDDWVAALDLLLDDEATRARLGSLARRRALLEWAPALQSRRYLAILEAVVARGPLTDRVSTWASVALDEPAVPMVIEGYGMTVEVAPHPAPLPPVAPAAVGPRRFPPPDRLLELARRGWVQLRRDGVGPTTTVIVAKVRVRVADRRQPRP